MTGVPHMSMERDHAFPVTIVPQKNPGDGENRYPNYSSERVALLKQVDNALQALGRVCGGVELRMGRFGITQFMLYKFVVVVEVTDEFARVYTLLHRTSRHDGMVMRYSLLEAAMELNYLQIKTCGACLSIDPCPAMEGELEVTFSHQFYVKSMPCDDFVRMLLNFMQCTMDLHKELMKRMELPTEMQPVGQQQQRREQQHGRKDKDDESKMWIRYPSDHPRDYQVLYVNQQAEKEEGFEERDAVEMSRSMDDGDQDEERPLEVGDPDYFPPGFFMASWAPEDSDTGKIQPQRVDVGTTENKVAREKIWKAHLSTDGMESYSTSEHDLDNQSWTDDEAMAGEVQRKVAEQVIPKKRNNKVQLLTDDMEHVTPFDQLQDSRLYNEHSKIVTQQHEAKRKVEMAKKVVQPTRAIVKPARTQPKRFESAIPRIVQPVPLVHTVPSPPDSPAAPPRRRQIVAPKGYSRR